MTVTAPTRERAAAPAPAAATAKKSFLKSKQGIIAILALIGVAVGVYLTVLKPAPAATVAGPAKPGPIVNLAPTTVNLAGGHYLKVVVAVQLAQGQATAATFKPTQALALVIDEFADRTVASVSTAADRQTIVKDLVAHLDRAYPKEIYTAYLTQFVTQ